jgi:hypothetical protein
MPKILNLVSPDTSDIDHPRNCGVNIIITRLQIAVPIEHCHWNFCETQIITRRARGAVMEKVELFPIIKFPQYRVHVFLRVTYQLAKVCLDFYRRPCWVVQQKCTHHVKIIVFWVQVRGSQK